MKNKENGKGHSESLKLTSLELYFRDVRETPLLSREEEIALAKQIKSGNKQAWERMILANLRFVIKIAREYEDFGLPLLDLINAGNIGLMKAVEKFDPHNFAGARFTTYAVWWIKNFIKKTLACELRTIRLPKHVLKIVQEISRVKREYLAKFGIEPSIMTLARRLGLDPKRVLQINGVGNTVPLEAYQLSNRQDGKEGKNLPDERSANPYEELAKKTDRTLLEESIRRLPEREQKILELRFGLNGYNEHTLEEVRGQFGVTRERIRQLQQKALGKLRKMFKESNSSP